MKGTDEREYVSDLFYATGCFDSEYSPLFLSGALRLTEGRHVTESNSGIILYEGLAEKYGLSLGDTLEIKNGNPDDPLVECEIAGLFEVIADGDDEQATMAKPSTLFDYKDYVFVNMDTMSAVSAPYTVSEGNGIDSVDFFVSDAAKLESIVQEVQNSTSIDWNSYYITVNNEVYERISSSIADTTTLVTTLIVVITVVSMVLIILILSMSIRSRKRETGILLAVGIAKPAVILQYVLETLLIAVVAFPLAYLSQQAGCRRPGDAIRQGGGECHRHTGALYAGSHRGRRPAGGGSAGVQYLDHAAETQADFVADGIRPSTPKNNEMR